MEHERCCYGILEAQHAGLDKLYSTSGDNLPTVLVGARVDYLSRSTPAVLSLGTDTEGLQKADWVAVGDMHATKVQAAVLHV